jgi:hypothetical protein
VPEIFKLVVRALLGHDVQVSNSECLPVLDVRNSFHFTPELVKLVSKTMPAQGGTPQRSVIPDVFQGIYNRWRVEWKAKKVIYER